jgi:hypothetical protein
MPLARLTIDIEAQLAGLQSGLDKAARLNEKAVAGIEARWAKIDSVARNLGVALAGAFSAKVLVDFTSATVDALDALNDAKDATGATVETLSALEDIARRNGATLDDVTGILVKFNGVLKEADGKNAQSQALKAIGLEAAELRKLDPAEALRKVAVALSGYADDGNKARLVQELFGKSIREAAPFLKDLAEAGKLNATVTTQQAEQAEKFNKQIAAMKINASDLGRTLTADLLPHLNKLLETLKQIPQNFNDKYALGKAQISSRQLKEETDRLLSLQAMATSGPEASRPLFAKRVEEQREVVAKLTREAFAANEALKELIGVRTDANYSNEGRTSSPPKPPLPDRIAGIAMPKAPDLTLPTDLQDMLKRLESTDTAKIQRLNDEIARMQSLLIAGSQDPNMTAGLKSALKELDELTKPRELPDYLGQVDEAMKQRTEEWKARNEEALDFIEEAERKMKEAAIENSIGSSLKMALKGDFDGILKMWEDMIYDMIASEATKALMQALNLGKGNTGSGGLFDALKTIFGGAGGGATPSANGNAFGPGGLIPFANGGVVNGATLFGFGGGRRGVMGEAGPEAILPLRRGRDGKLGVSGGSSIDASIGAIHVGSNVSIAEVHAAVTQAQRTQEMRLMRLKREGRF